MIIGKISSNFYICKICDHSTNKLIDLGEKLMHWYGRSNKTWKINELINSAKLNKTKQIVVSRWNGNDVLSYSSTLFYF